MIHQTPSFSKPSLTFHLLFIVLTAVVTGILIDLVLRFFVTDKAHSTLDVIIIAMIFTVTFTGSFRVWGRFLIRYFPLNSIKNLWTYIGSNSIVLIIAFFVAGAISTLIYTDIQVINIQSPVFYLVLGVSFIASVIGNTIYYGYDFYHHLMDAERKRHESQLAALKAQINPHFLFNALNSIASLARTDPELTEQMTQNLADLFRYSLQSSKKQTVTVEEELESVQTYLSIEKVRFGDRLQYDAEIDPEAYHIEIPGLILQPLIENCIKHGYNRSKDTFKIRLTACIKNDLLLMEVSDSGNGFGDETKEQIFARGTGMSNVNERLELHYGERAALTFSNQTVVLHIPVISNKK